MHPLMQNNELKKEKSDHIFSGNILILWAYDVGEDINLQKIEESDTIIKLPLQLPKHFKQYNVPVAIELPHSDNHSLCIGNKIHSFGAVSITYKIPFTDTLENLRVNCNELANKYQQQSIQDAQSIYQKIEPFIIQPKFFQTSASYVIIQVDPQPMSLDLPQLQKEYGSTIASTLRFETEILSEVQKNEILDSAIGYFRGSLIVIDIDAAFVYEEDYDDIIDLFEFANIQQLELRFFDRLLDHQINTIYERKETTLSWGAYLPFFGTFFSDPVGQLRKLKADISVITERLESSIKIAGEPYYSEIHNLLADKLDLKNWHDGIDRKLRIVEDVQTVFQQKIDANREDLFSVLIIILIFIELMFGILSYLKG
ncbi:MAG TPA: hypothetical protein VLB80_00860 [Candidatus Babeliales bacterium]|nr:hypothetical protein [Candidatus Babeliales bacterium]